MPTVKVDGGVVLVREKAHRCQKPEPRRFDIGDVFICGDCQSRYVLEDAQQYQGGPFWKETRTTYPISTSTGEKR